jgi:iron complex transport system substrate-binding protein
METRPAFRSAGLMRVVALLAGALGIGAGVAAAADPLPRIMSLNVCTDQLVMLLAEPEQIVSLSDLSSDPQLSFFHARAAAHPKNRGLAEEVFLARPDVVVTGTYSLHNTTALLEKLEIPVEEFAFNQSLDTIPGELRRMGTIIGRAEKAEEMATAYEGRRAELEAGRCGPDPSLIGYEQNGIALGRGTLADAAIRAAGFRNLAAESGYDGMTPLPLETLVSLRPDVLVLPEALAGTPSLADQVSDHPALRALPQTRRGTFVPRGAWSCGGPFVLEAVAALRRIRDDIVACPGKGAPR